MKLNYFVIPLITLITGWLGGWFTNQGMSWYETINKPGWTPPGSVIGMVWTLIYILTAICALIVWNKFKRNKKFWIIISLFILNAVLNFGWSYLFFYKGLIGASIIEMIVLGLTIISLIYLIGTKMKKLSYLLYPYAIWVAFATYLAWSVFILN